MTRSKNRRLLLPALLGSVSIALCLIAWPPMSLAQDSESKLQVFVHNERSEPLLGVKVEAAQAGLILVSSTTSSDGKATVACPGTKECLISFEAAGYLPLHLTVSRADMATGTVLEVALSSPKTEEQTVTVNAGATSPVVEPAGNQSSLKVEEVKTSVLRPATLLDTLPLVPGVIRTPDGRIKIAGMDEQHSALLINSVDVSDPATGNFGLSVPVDTVEAIKVSLSPYLAQYGNFTAGVVSAQTRRGGEKWQYGLNDPLPEFRIRSGHLQGLRSATPRLNIDGPLIANRLYLMEGTEYLIDKAEVRTLPFPFNETRTQAFNSFTQLDATMTPNHAVTASLHFAPHELHYANLNYFDPQPVTPNADYQEDTGTIVERWAIGKGLLTSTFAGTRVATNVAPQATGPMLLSPLGNSGSYFGQESRQATRFQWVERWSSAPANWHGRHFLDVGSVLAHAEDDGEFNEHPTSVQDASGHLLRRIDFSGSGAFNLDEFEPAVYAQDHWVMRPNFAMDLGIRAEAQSLTYTRRFAPRIGFTWEPAATDKTIVQGGIGVFYDEVPLDVYAFGRYPNQIVTTYDGNGNVIDGPRTYLNLTSTAAASEFPFLAQKQVSGNFAPYSVAWNVEAQHTVTAQITARLRYLHSDARNQLNLQPQINSRWSAFVLGDAGTGQTRQFDATAELGSNKRRQFFFSYVRQFARGDQSDADGYLGNFPFPVVRNSINASNAGEMPNRFLLWGTSELPLRMRISPRLELRNGFAWQPTDVLQNYVDLSSFPQPRFPRYFTADARASKDINVGPKHAVRFSVTGINLSNHQNPLQVHYNTSDPQYRTFFGNYGRHMLVDFDFLF
jgi:hypothetical protein